ncbi:MAG: spermidine synthase [Arenicella sp.]
MHIFEELDYQKTPLGDISLRRRSEPKLNNQILYEVKLGEEFLMSSLFVEAEEQLSLLGLQKLKENGHKQCVDIVVGGLGLGYTAVKALQDSAVSSLKVIDVMQPVISWHQKGLLPVGDVLATDRRCQLIHDDFFAVATTLGGFSPEGLQPNSEGDSAKVHAVLLDIDHSPSHWLNEGNSGFYTQESLYKMSANIHSGGVFGLWSNELPDPKFAALLNQVFANTESHIVNFSNPYSGGESINSVYIATVA